jgi:hypothetical protein
MVIRPIYITDRMKESRWSSNSNDTFTLPLADARAKAREILGASHGGYGAIVERWRQLPDGNIEFRMRRIPMADA